MFLRKVFTFSMAIILRYEHIPRKDKTLVRAPFIRVQSRDSEGNLVVISGLLDSGADSTVVPKEMAEYLGLKEGKELDTGGIGGFVKVRMSKMQVTVKGLRESYPLLLDVLVIQDKLNTAPLIFGRNGFFEHFHVTFRQDEEKIALKKIKPR